MISRNSKKRRSKNQKPSLSPNQTKDLSQSSKHYVPSTGTTSHNAGTARQTSKYIFLHIFKIHKMEVFQFIWTVGVPFIA